MTATGRLSRLHDWWPQKITPLLGVGYALLLVRGGGASAMATLILSVAGLSSVAAYAYMMNDATDVAEDARRLKPNAMSGRSWPWRIAAITVPLVAAFGLAALAGGGRVAMALLAIECAIPILYSVPPFRLKDRGATGMTADAMLVHGLPTAWIAVMLAPHGTETLRSALVAACAVAWASGLGFRGILVHRYRVEQVSPPVVTRTMSPERLQAVVLRRLLPFEWVALSAFILLLVPVAFLLVPAAILYAVVEWQKRREGWRIPYLGIRDAEPAYVPLAFSEAYEIWIPLILVAQLAIADPTYWLLTAAHVVAFLPSIQSCVRVNAGLFSRERHA